MKKPIYQYLAILSIFALSLISCQGSSVKEPVKQPSDGNGTTVTPTTGSSFQWTSETEIESGVYNTYYQPTFIAQDPSEWTFGLVGKDSEYFYVKPETGQLRSIKRVDRVYPWDSNKDGVYEVILTAHNKAGELHSLPLTISAEPRKTGTDSISEARILFPVHNSNIGLGADTEIEVLVKVSYWDNSPDRDPNLQVSGVQAEYVEGSDGIWRASIRVLPGERDISLNVASHNYPQKDFIRIYNTLPKKPAEQFQGGRRSGCSYPGFGSNHVFIYSTHVTDLRHGHIYLHNRDHLCKYDFYTQKFTALTQHYRDEVIYPVISSSNDRQRLVIIDWHYNGIEYDTVSNRFSTFSTEYKGPDGHFGGGFSLPISLNYNWDTGKGVFATYNGKLLSLDLSSNSTSIIRDLGQEDPDAPVSVEMNWENNTAYFGTVEGHLIEKNILSSGEEKILFTSSEESDALSAAFRSRYKDLIVGGKSNGGLFRYDLASGEISSIVENQGSGLDIQFAYGIELDRTDSVATFIDPFQRYFFLVSLVSGDRVIVEGLTAPQ